MTPIELEDFEVGDLVGIATGVVDEEDVDEEDVNEEKMDEGIDADVVDVGSGAVILTLK